MGNTWFETRLVTFTKRWRRRREEKQLTAALMTQIEQIARDRNAGFRMVSGYSKKIVGPAESALKYIQERLSVIPDPVVLNPDRWGSDGYLNALFVDPDDIRDLLGKSKPLGSFFDKENVSQAVALITADWKQKKIMGIEKEGEIIKRDVPQSALYFENHRIMEVGATVNELRDQVCRRILGALIIKVIMEIQGLQHWSSDLEKERALLELFIHSPDTAESVADETDDEMRVIKARQVVAELKSKEQDLRVQLGDAENQLGRVVAVLLNPQPLFNIERVSLRLNRLGVQVTQQTREPVNEISLAKCALVDQLSKAVLWAQVNR